MYVLTCHKVSLLFELQFLIMLHIKCNIVLTLETRCGKSGVTILYRFG